MESKIMKAVEGGHNICAIGAKMEIEHKNSLSYSFNF